MRAMVRVLRSDAPADPSPPYGIGDLPRLAGRDGHGPAVDVRVRGDVDDLPPRVGTTIYQLAQESVTNALRHAHDAEHVRIEVTADEATVRLDVRDDGAPVPAGTPPGYGLLGMAERAALLGGTCTAGPAEGGGWTVTATLPRRAR
jgi:signal transduction histidine kinase